MKLGKISKAVEKVLEAEPRARDNDNLLISYIWAKQAESGGMDIHKNTIADFLNTFSKTSTFSNAESIRRSRQKLQEENPNLRGVKYKHRQQVQEPETRREIRMWGHE